MMKKTCTLIIVLAILAIGVGKTIKDTYSKYASTGDVGISGTSGAWSIKVNSENITADHGAVQEFTIQNLIYEESDNVISNKIAPGLDAYFEIGIDATDTAVAVKFDITFDTSSIDATNRIKMTDARKYVDGVLDDGAIIKTDENTYTGIIYLQEIQEEKDITVRCYIEWPDEETETSDEADSKIGSDANLKTLNIPVTVNVTQYLGETISEYTGE